MNQPTKADSPRGLDVVRSARLAHYTEAVLRYQALAHATQHPVARELARLAELRLALAEIEVAP